MKHKEHDRKFVFPVKTRGINCQYSEIMKLHSDWLGNPMCLAYRKLLVQQPPNNSLVDVSKNKQTNPDPNTPIGRIC